MLVCIFGASFISYRNENNKYLYENVKIKTKLIHDVLKEEKRYIMSCFRKSVFKIPKQFSLILSVYVKSQPSQIIQILPKY